MDGFSTFFHVLFIFIAAMTTLISIDYLRRENMNHAEYYALLLFATAGMLVMAGSNELMMIFIGLEILSIANVCDGGLSGEPICDPTNPRSSTFCWDRSLRHSSSTALL